MHLSTFLSSITSITNFNIARDTTDPGYWVWNLNYHYSYRRNTNLRFSIFSLPPLLEDHLYHLVPLPVILLVHHHLNDHHCPNNIHIYCRQHDHINHLQHSVQPLCPHLASPFQLALLSKWPPNQDTHCLSHPPPCLPYSSPPSSHRPTPTWLPLAIWLYLSICITL